MMIKCYNAGIDVGSSSIKVAILDNENNLVFEQYQLHKGHIKNTLEAIFMQINKKINISTITHGAITGSLSKHIIPDVLIPSVNEVSAAIEGSIYLHPEAKSIVEIGGQSAKYYTGFNTQKEHTFNVSKKSMLQMSSNSDCAAGTGSFLEEQASRLNIDIEKYSEYAQKAKSVPRIAGRCSVFAKTDIIHHQQEGVPSEDILKGIAYAIVKNYKGAVIRRLPVKTPVLFIGGVAKNQAVIDALRDVLQKNESELIVPKHSDTIGAIGAALIAKKETLKLDFQKLFYDLSTKKEEDSEDLGNEDLIPLSIIPPENITEKHKIVSSKNSSPVQSCYLGIDIGSTSTNLISITPNGKILNYKYIRTQGDPLKAVQEGMKELNKEANEKLNISGLGITGSGRYLIGKQIGADIIKDEITAQAKAAIKIDPEVDTIFEIGGQDSKFISITNGTVTDFQMNKVCAAGTGSFLDEQAQEFNISVEELGQLAFKGEHPVSLGERCTVFIKSSIASNLSRGKQNEDIAAGLCYSIAKNYLHRVVGQKKIGNKILLQGGIAFNQGVVNAFKILTGKQITITPFFSVTGAYGAALMACEAMKNKKTTFIGIEKLENGSLILENQKEVTEKNKIHQFNKRIEKTIFEDYDNSIDPKKKTVGIPRALFTYGMFPMFNAIFKSLNFNVLLSDWSNEKTIKIGQEYAMEETCFPVKLILGHIADLISQKVDYIFFPDLYTVDHPGSESRKNFGCAYMQLAFKIVNQTMELEKKGIKLVAPTFAFSMGKEFMQNSFSSLGKLLEKSREETGYALKKGMEAYLAFETRMETNGKNAMKELNPNKITFVLVSKIYGIADPVLNLDIPDKLIDLGCQVISFFDLPEGINIAKEHSNMYWPFGQHILEPAYLIREYPNMYPILLTHHGCGPDSVLLHFFKEIMGDKPYLNIEIDEHASKVGVTTRLEAFVNSLKIENIEDPKDIEFYINKISYKNINIKQKLIEAKPGTKLYIPNIQPYSELFKEVLIHNGYNAEILKTNANTIGLGRKYTLTNEYYSLTSFLGGCFNTIKQDNEEKNITFLIPQTEGAEVEGQYHRILKTKLDEYKHVGVDVVSPFLEDVISLEDNVLKPIFHCILAGDIINVASKKDRNKYLLEIKQFIKDDNLNISTLKSIAANVYSCLKKQSYNKRIMAIGEPMIVYNDYLNDFIFNILEKQHHKIVYGVLSEAIWVFWKDYIKQNKDSSENLSQKITTLKEDMEQISRQLNEESPFTPNIETIVKKADATIGYYSGAFARYREAKTLCNSVNIDGIITVASLYENTGVSLNILHDGFSDETSKPILNLTFDGNNNENDKSKVESFIYYL